MADIHDEVVSEIYRSYSEARHSSQKSETIERGVKEIFLNLKRYVNNPDKFREKSEILLNELQDLLDRYYYQNKQFTEQLLFEAKAYILELSTS
jgi:hypothetical protein